MPAPKPARRPIAPAAPLPRAKKLPALALVGRIAVGPGAILQIAKAGRVVATEPLHGEDFRAGLRAAAQYYFGRGGVLKKSVERGVWLVFQ